MSKPQEAGPVMEFRGGNRLAVGAHECSHVSIADAKAPRSLVDYKIVRIANPSGSISKTHFSSLPAASSGLREPSKLSTWQNNQIGVKERKPERVNTKKLVKIQEQRARYI